MRVALLINTNCACDMCMYSLFGIHPHACAVSCYVCWKSQANQADCLLLLLLAFCALSQSFAARRCVRTSFLRSSHFCLGNPDPVLGRTSSSSSLLLGFISPPSSSGLAAPTISSSPPISLIPFIRFRRDTRCESD